MRKQIPNLITLCNLLCGVVATWLAVQGETRAAAWMICLGILFDFFDGMAARLLGVASPMGKELDSLADVVTSGVAPAMILMHWLGQQIDGRIAALAFLMPLFAAYRLAKFNLDSRQSHSFLGLPVPSNALIWVGFALSHWNIPSTTAIAIVIIALSIVGDVLMVSELPMFSLKFNFKQLAWKDNKIPYLFLIGCAVIICAIRDGMAISAIIVWYIVLSLLTSRHAANR